MKTSHDEAKRQIDAHTERQENRMGGEVFQITKRTYRPSNDPTKPPILERVDMGKWERF
jgi:hypothetical protein